LPVIIITIPVSAFIDIRVFFLLLLASGAYFLCFRRYYKTIALKQGEVFIQGKTLAIGSIYIFNNIRLVKSSLKESQFESRIKEISSNHVESNLVNENLKSAVYFWCTLIGSLTVTGVLFLLWNENNHNVSKVFVTILISLLFVIFIILSIPSLFAFYKSKAVFDRFMELYFYEQTIKKVKNDNNGVENINIQNIRAQDVSIRYPVVVKFLMKYLLNSKQER